jgi:hypothetical protein
MTQAAKKLVGEFDALPEAEREQVLAELLRRAAAGPHDLPNDKDLTAVADQVFQELDRREQKR